MNTRLPLPTTRVRVTLAITLAGLLLAACGSTPNRSAAVGNTADAAVRLQPQADRCELTLSGEIDQVAVQQVTRALDQMASQRCEQRWLVLQANQGQIGRASCRERV